MDLLREYWWVFLFISFTSSGFLVAASYQKSLLFQVKNRIYLLEEKRQHIIGKKDLYEEKMMSIDDPDFITMTLIRVLGVTPKGHKKVVFNK